MNKKIYTKTLPIVLAFLLGGLVSEVIAPSMQAHAQASTDSADLNFDSQRELARLQCKYISSVLLVIDPTKTPAQLQNVLDYYVLAGFSVKATFVNQGVPCIVLTK